jgi:hypothetical protein
MGQIQQSVEMRELYRLINIAPLLLPRPRLQRLPYGMQWKTYKIVSFVIMVIIPMLFVALCAYLGTLLRK